MSKESINIKALRSLILFRILLEFSSRHLEKPLAGREEDSPGTSEADELRLIFSIVENDDSKNELVKLNGHPQLMSQNHCSFEDPRSE